MNAPTGAAMDGLGAILGDLYFHACALDDATQAYVMHEPVYRVAVGVKAVVILARHIPEGDAWRTAAAEVTAYLNALDLTPWTGNVVHAGIARLVGILKDRLARLQPYTVRATPEAPPCPDTSTPPWDFTT